MRLCQSVSANTSAFADFAPATTTAVEEFTAFLKSTGLAADGYHGRLSARRRAATQDRFMADGFKALVATNAFGLGIDKPDIRFVLHYHLPATTEAFYGFFLP